jgi:acyl phosphate:glycerol-3-phosphate acyltransferase
MTITIYSFFAIPIAYFLGAIPSAFIIGKLMGTDIRTAGAHRVSGVAVYKRLGIIPFLTVVAMDVVKGVIAIIIARLLANIPIDAFAGNLTLFPLLIMLFTGIAAVAGHIWSVFIKFKGGLGAAVMYGVLAGMIIPQEIAAMIISLPIYITTRKSGIGTVLIVFLICFILLVQKIATVPNWPPFYFPAPGMSPLLIIYPAILFLLQIIRRAQVKMTSDS